MKNIIMDTKIPFIQKKKINSNFTIIRTKAFASDRKTIFKKLCHYFVFMISAILNIGRIKNYDALIISSPPLFTGVVGIFVKKFYGKDYWLDLRDLWPDSALELEQINKGRLFRFGKILEAKIYENAKGFIFPVPSFRRYLSKFSNEVSKKPMIDLMNGVSRKFINEAKIHNKSYQNKFTVLYSGNMGLAQDLKTIIKTAKILTDYDIYFDFIGEGVCKSEIRDLAKDYKVKVLIHDSKPRKELIKSIMESSVCLVPLKNKKLFNFALPSKMFEYMACGKPVIVGIDGDAKEIVKSSKSGICVQPENPEMLADAILTYFHNKNKLLDHGKNGLRFIKNNLEKEYLVKNLIKEMKKSFE